MPAALPPLPNTAKPRPHICATCHRSFARLEHLKRHERSHTKEKPFVCPQCSRGFARRDLLLRHQQKLHQLHHHRATSARPRQARRGSRKNSPPASTIDDEEEAERRSRANAINYMDPNAWSNHLASQHAALIGAAAAAVTPSRHHHLSALEHRHHHHLHHPHDAPFDGRDMTLFSGRHEYHGLPRFNDGHVANPLAPPLPPAVNPDRFFTPPSASSTINPNQLHHLNHPPNFHPHLIEPLTGGHMMDEEELDWMAGSLVFADAYNLGVPYSADPADYAVDPFDPFSYRDQFALELA